MDGKTMRRTLLLLLVVLITTSCFFNRKEVVSLTSYDKNCLELFFRALVTESAAGYSIYGNKPVSWEGFAKNDINLSTDDQIAKQEAILREGYRVWVQSGLAEKTNKIAICATDEPSVTGVNDLFILNKQAFLKVVQANLPIFQYVLGPKVTPYLLLDQFIHARKPMLSTLRTDRVLNGIVLGYGTQNALVGSRTEYLHEYLEHLSAQLTPDYYPDQPIHSSLPSFGFQTIQEEFEALSEGCTVERHRNPELVPPLPWFGSIPSQETDLVLSEYRTVQKKLSKLLNSPYFLEEILSQLLEKKVVLLVSEHTSQVPFASLLYEKVKLKPNLSVYLGQALFQQFELNKKYILTDVFFEGMRDSEQRSGNAFSREAAKTIGNNILEKKHEFSFLMGQKFWDRFCNLKTIVVLEDVIASAKEAERLEKIDLSEKWEAIEQLDLLSYLTAKEESDYPSDAPASSISRTHLGRIFKFLFF